LSYARSECLVHHQLKVRAAANQWMLFWLRLVFAAFSCLKEF
jgi:hypothetical protein